MKKTMIFIVSILLLCVFGFSDALAEGWFAIRPNISDEDFFGVWDGSSWTRQSKLNYQYNDGMYRVGEHVKAGNYALAQSELLSYFRRRPVKQVIGRGNAALAGLAAENILFMSMVYVNQHPIEGTEWQNIQVDVKNAASLGIFGVQIIAKNKSDKPILIAGKDSPNPPVLRVMLNGQITQVYPTVTACVSVVEDYANPINMFVQESGYPFDDNTTRAFITFDLSSMSGTLTDAVLDLYVQSPYEEENVLVLFQDNVPTVPPTWETRVDRLYSWQGGTAEQLNWPGATVNTLEPEIPGMYGEYGVQVPRFDFFANLVGQYYYTNDEYYAYNAIRLTLDFFYDKGLASVIQPIEEGLVGGYPRSLDTSFRLTNLNTYLPVLVGSEHMTPERFTEIMKNIWLGTDFLTNTKTDAYHPYNNWGASETRGMLTTPITFPEFSDAQGWISLGKSRINFMSSTASGNAGGVVMPDGAYNEDASGYTGIALRRFTDYMDILDGDSTGLSQTFLDALNSLGEYYMNLFTNAGEGIGWGDAGVGMVDSRSNDGALLNAAKFSGNEYVKYVLTRGKQGVAPPYTSKLYPDKRVAFLRSGWEKDDLYLFVENAGNNKHSHLDDMGIIVSAYGQHLLTDSGVMDYSDTDGISTWQKSTEAHNTVMMNNTNQRSVDAGGTDFFTTSDEFDFWQGWTNATSNFRHTRSVTFVRPNYWIVSDYINPSNMSDTYPYRQLWHSPVSFKLSGKNAKTSFASGINMQVVPIDSGEIPVLKKGYVSIDNTPTRQPLYVSYEKSGKGDTSFDTVLYPSRSTDTTQVRSRRIDVGVEGSAAQIYFQDESSQTSDYYYISFKNGNYPVAEFERFAFDGKVCVVENDELERVSSASVAYGSFLQEDGRDLIRAEYTVQNLTVEWDTAGLTVQITSSYDLSAAGSLLIYAPEALNMVTVNGDAAEYAREGDYIVLGG